MFRDTKLETLLFRKVKVPKGQTSNADQEPWFAIDIFRRQCLNVN